MTTRKRSGGRPTTSRRDFKATGGGGSGHRLPGWLWLGIGLLSGVVMALFVYVRDQDIERRVPVAKAPAPTVIEPAANAGKVAKPEPEETIFEFYDMLPKMLRGEGETEAAAKATAARKTPPPKPAREQLPEQAPAKAPVVPKHQAAPKLVSPAPPAAKPKPARSTSSLVYYLQAGSFQHYAQADRLRAQLAFNGLESYIQQVSGADRRTWHRVRVGPYTSRREADQASVVLSRRFQLRSLLVKARR